MTSKSTGKSGDRIRPVGVIYLYGGLIYASILAWDWFVRGVTWNLQWWQHLLAPLVAGIAGVVLEAIGTFVGNGFSFQGNKQSKWQKVAAFVGMLILLAGFMIGVTMWQISRV